MKDERGERGERGGRLAIKRGASSGLLYSK